MWMRLWSQADVDHLLGVARAWRLRVRRNPETGEPVWNSYEGLRLAEAAREAAYASVAPRFVALVGASTGCCDPD